MDGEGRGRWYTWSCALVDIPSNPCFGLPEASNTSKMMITLY